MLNDSTTTLSIVPYSDCMINKGVLYRSAGLELITGGITIAVGLWIYIVSFNESFRLSTIAPNLVEALCCHGESAYLKVNLRRQIVGYFNSQMTAISAQVTNKNLRPDARRERYLCSCNLLSSELRPVLTPQSKVGRSDKTLP